MQTTDNEVIEEILKYTGYNRLQLSKELNLNSAQIFYDIKSGKCGISKELAKRIKDKFLNLNMSWILTGEGDMIINNTNYDISNKNVKGVKLYDISATAGFFDTYNNSAKIIDEISLPNMPSADGAIFARGESMSPVINDGDIIGFRMLQKNSPICWGEIYIISYTINGDYFTCIKRLHKVDDKVRLVSINEDYSPIDIPKESITHIALVVFSLNIHKYAY